MTGLVFLAPEGFLALAVLPLLVLLDRFARRRVDVAVGSLHLFRRLAPGPGAPPPDAARRRRLFRAPLLLRLLAAALAAALLARPAIVGDAGAGSRFVALLDRSASLGAVDRGRPRFDAVREELLAFLDSRSPRDRVLLLEAPTGAPIGEEGDPAAVRRRVPERPGAAADDWPRALGAARAAAARADAPADPILVFSDHAPDGAAPARVVSRGAPVANAGIVSVAFPDGSAGDPFVVLAASVAGRARLFADDAVAAEIDVAPGALAGATLAGGAGASAIRVEMPGDSLAADDVAPLAPAGRGGVAVAFTGRPADPATRRALAFLPGVRFVGAADSPDLEVAFGSAPSLAAGVAVLVDPPGGDYPGIGRVAAEKGRVRALRDGDGRLAGVSTLARAGVREARRIEPAPGARAVLLAAFEGEAEEAPILVRSGAGLAIGFDPAATPWPESPLFPAFWAAAFDERFGAGGGAERVVATGSARSVAAPGPLEATLVPPDGSARRRLAPLEGAYRFVPDAVGVYRLETPDGRTAVVGAAVLSAGETACPGADSPFVPAGDGDRNGPGARPAPSHAEAPLRIALSLLAAAAVLLAVFFDRRSG